MTKTSRKTATIYRRNVVAFSSLTKKFFFCPKMKVLEGGVLQVVGEKYDVTEDLQKFVQKRYRRRSEDGVVVVGRLRGGGLVTEKVAG